MTTHLYDCFIFLNELDVLEWRFRELEDLVDTFVVVEATRTFRGTEKPLHLWNNRQRFKPWWGKVHHIVEENMPTEPTDDPRLMYTVEGVQRDRLAEGLVNAGPDDTVMVSDVDEIPRASVVGPLIGTPTAYQLEQRLFYYALNLEFPHYPPWYGTRIGPKWAFDRCGGMAFRIAQFPVVRDAGWHFSFFGGPEVMAEKVRAWSHASAFVPEEQGDPVEWMERARRSGTDWDIHRKQLLRWVEVDGTYPRAIVEDPKRWQYHVVDNNLLQGLQGA